MRHLEGMAMIPIYDPRRSRRRRRPMAYLHRPSVWRRLITAAVGPSANQLRQVALPAGGAMLVRPDGAPYYSQIGPD